MPGVPPSAGAADVTSVFAALGDATRTSLLARLAEEGGSTATRLAATAHVSRQAVNKHLRVLTGAGLVEPRRRGREVVYALDPAALERSQRWLAELGKQWERRLLAIKLAAEEGAAAPRK